MSETRCETILDRLPDFAGGRLLPSDAASIEAHLAECPECAAEADLLALLHASRPTAPDGLVTRIEQEVRAPRRSAHRPWWGLAAASVAAVALGIGVVAKDSTPTGEAEVPAMVAGAEETSLWVADDGVVAGAPALDGLSEEALLMLLDEMESDPTGGAA